MRGGVVGVKRGHVACVEYTLTSCSGAIDEIPELIVQWEGLGAKGFDHLCLVATQIL
jgi:hypothetical protein